VTLIERVARALERLSAPDHIAVAVSGGADSVFLLHAVHAAGKAAAVLHVNHGLRGAESDADEAFVRRIAVEMGILCHVWQGIPEAGNLEQEARRVRHEIFAKVVADGLCEAVATGHSLDDQAETVLARLLRGAGSAGLSGIRPCTAAGLIRPLLGLRRAEIREWLTEQGIVWRDDSSNLDPGFLRNRIRLELLRRLEEINPSLTSVLSGMADWARGEEDYWLSQIASLEAKYLSGEGPVVLFRTTDVASLPVAVERRLIRRALERVKGDLRSIDFHHVEGVRALLRLPEGSGRIQVPGVDVFRSFDWMRLAPPGFDSSLPRDFETEVAVPGVTHLPERSLTIEMELVTGANVYNEQMDVVKWAGCATIGSAPLILRNWRPGDSYTPVGSSGPEKLKTLFQRHRIPLWERRSWPLITQNSSIVWTRLFGTAAGFSAGEGGRVVRIREARESNRVDAASKQIDGHAPGPEAVRV
jgi:tRNA(Ile)-lysidine synthase